MLLKFTIRDFAYKKLCKAFTLCRAFYSFHKQNSPSITVTPNNESPNYPNIASTIFIAI